MNPNFQSVVITQSVAILIDGNNMERSIHEVSGDDGAMINFDTLIPKLIVNRALNRLIYFREGRYISSKLAARLHNNYHGSVRPCHKSADIPLSITAMQLASKVDTIIIMSGDSDFIELVRHLKSEGVRVEIAAVPESTSNLLVEEADYYHVITEEDWFTFQPQGQGQVPGFSQQPQSHANLGVPVRKKTNFHLRKRRYTTQESTMTFPSDSVVLPDDSY
jgi:uncharacterized LabA/DUF88 family protein